MTACCYCGKSHVDLRPYGPKGAMACFECVMICDDRIKEAERQFWSQLAAAGDIAIIGEPTGPRPGPGSRDPS